MLTALSRLILAFLPLASAPLLVHLIAEGHISFGGGEKDLVWILPWLLWSLIFGSSSLVLWHRRWPVVRSTVWSAAIGLAAVLLAAVVLGVFGQLGVAGRF
jgi:hypothetical protein